MTDAPSAGTEAAASTTIIGPPVAPVREVDIDGCLSLYRRDAECVVVLNETASDVWRLADGTLRRHEIVALLASAYGVVPDAIADDVSAALDRFAQEGFLTLDLR